MKVNFWNLVFMYCILFDGLFIAAAIYKLVKLSGHFDNVSWFIFGSLIISLLASIYGLTKSWKGS